MGRDRLRQDAGVRGRGTSFARREYPESARETACSSGALPMTTPAARPSARFTYIDALRGLAALWVAGHHFYPGVSNHYQTQPFSVPCATLMFHGGRGVDVFFVLSGFVI